MKTLSLLLIPVLLGGCAMTNPSLIQPQPIQVQNETVSHEFMADKASRSTLNAVADDITRRGEGAVSVIVHYPSKPNPKAAQHVATAQGSRIKSYLVARGVRHTIQTTFQATEIPGPNTIVISYDALKASAPSDCLDISAGDAGNYKHESDSPYRFGCANQQGLSAMIARPADLLGNDTNPVSDSTRLTKSQDAYRAGERATDKNDEGLRASTVYQ